MIKIWKNGQWKIVSSGSGGSGNVDDVKVNGTSVVTDKIANIDLTPYAKQDDLEKEVTNRQDAVSQCLADAKAYTDTEKSRAETAEGNLENYCDSLDATKAAQSDLESEISRATAAEADLNTAIGTEKANREAADNTISAAVTAETGRATGAEATLTASIGAVAGDLTSEVSRATTAESSKLDKVTTSGTDKVYVAMRDGTQSNIVLTTNDTGDSIVRRLSNANIVVPTTPNADNNATSKKYVNDTFAKITDLSSYAKDFSVDGSTIKWQSSTDRTLVANLPSYAKFKGKVATVGDLPTSGQVEGDLYFVGTATPYNIHIWNGSEWIAAGTTTIDISGKADQSALEAEISRAESAEKDLGNSIDTKQDKLTSAQLTACGSGITGTKVTTYDGYATTIANKIDLLGPEPVSGGAFNLPYYFYTIPSSTGIEVHTKTISLDNAKTYGDYSLAVPSATTSLAGLMSAADKTKLDAINPAEYIKLLGTEAVSGQPYHIPYHLAMTATATNIGLTAYTITLDNAKTLNQYPFTIPGATTTTAGLMNASDKSKLDSITPSDLATKAEVNAKLDATKCTYSTTAPTTAATDGGVHIVYLETEPTTKYAGYIYFIK